MAKTELYHQWQAIKIMLLACLSATARRKCGKCFPGIGHGFSNEAFYIPSMA